MHLFYMVCQSYFTRCPERNTTDIGNNTIYEVDRLVPLCKEMCYDFKEACAIDFQPMVNVIDCHSIPYSKETSNCVYMEVFCINPPVQIPNGPDTNPVNSTLKYTCPIGMQPANENQNVTCLFSGEWTEIPEYTLAMEVKILFAVSVATICFCWIKKRYYPYNQESHFVRRKRKYDAFVQHSHAADDEAFIVDVLLPNLEPDQNSQFKLFWQYDAFVQYSVATDDEAFVTDVLLPNLEPEQNSQFRLFLPNRDFLLGNYISSNIETAIANSNATIILLSQDYIDSPWCTYGFNSCLKEHNNDNAFKLFVILMQPIEELRLTPEMDRFLNTTAYLERHNPQLVQILKDLLADLRG